MQDEANHRRDKRHRAALIVGIATRCALSWAGLSFPGFPWIISAPAFLILISTVTAWTVVAAQHWRRPVLRTGVLITGILVVVTVAGVALHLPVRARFAASEAAFQSVVDQADRQPGNDDETGPACPERIGLFSIIDCQHKASGYVFYDAMGDSLVDDAGFAYLPEGASSLKSDGALELREVTHLQGDWYAFTSSW